MLSPKGEHHFSKKNFTAPQLHLPKANITGNGLEKVTPSPEQPFHHFVVPLPLHGGGRSGGASLFKEILSIS